MDETLLTVGVLLFILGLAGIYIAYSGVSETLDNGLQQFSALLVALGVAMIPGGLLRGGLPQVSGPKVIALLIVFVLGMSVVATTAALQIGPFKPPPEEIQVEESPEKTVVVIVPGSFIQTQAENFVPKTVRVVIGVNNTVVWMNKEEVDVSHTVTSETGLFDSGLFGSGKNWTYTFAKAGVYNYYCTPHPWMRGTIIVEELVS